MTTETQPTTVDATGQPASSGEQNGGQGEQQQPAISFASEAEFQKRVDDMLKERLEREQKKAEKTALKAREDALAEQAAKNGEWQQLAEQRAARLTDMETQLATLESTTTKAQRYEQALSRQVEAQRKDLPKHLLPLLDKLDVVEQMEWLAANREQLAPPKTTGVPATPRAQGSTDAAAQEQARQQSASFYRTL
jgi:molecular chaperone GrpE (heat shock protein)